MPTFPFDITKYLYINLCIRVHILQCRPLHSSAQIWSPFRIKNDTIESNNTCAASAENLASWLITLRKLKQCEDGRNYLYRILLLQQSKLLMDPANLASVWPERERSVGQVPTPCISFTFWTIGIIEQKGDRTKTWSFESELSQNCLEWKSSCWIILFHLRESSLWQLPVCEHSAVRYRIIVT